MQGLAPHLPFVVARIGVEAHLDTTVAHGLHDIVGVFDARVLFATAHEEHVELFIECFGISQHAWHLFLQIEVRGTANAAKHTRGEDLPREE